MTSTSSKMMNPKILFKEFKEKLIATKPYQFDFGKQSQCFYGTVFDNSFSEEAFEFKKKHKFSLYDDGDIEDKGGKEDEYLLREGEEYNKSGLTALEAVSAYDKDYGQALAVVMRLIFKFTVEEVIAMNLY